VLLYKLMCSLGGAALVLVLAQGVVLAQQPGPAAPPARSTEKAVEGVGRPPRLDVIYVPTPQVVVDAMLELAQVKKEDLVYDLGCGDGRIVVTAAARYGSKALGVDIDPRRVAESLANVKKHEVGKLVTIRRADIFETDLREASVVTLYLLPNLNARLLPQLESLKPGSRVVAHSFDIKGMKPKKVVKVPIEGKGERTIYLYIAPLEKEPLSKPVSPRKPTVSPAASTGVERPGVEQRPR
jgi:SAM-dependent methyltransferase